MVKHLYDAFIEAERKNDVKDCLIYEDEKKKKKSSALPQKEKASLLSEYPNVSEETKIGLEILDEIVENAIGMHIIVPNTAAPKPKNKAKSSSLPKIRKQLIKVKKQPIVVGPSAPVNNQPIPNNVAPLKAPVMKFEVAYSPREEQELVQEIAEEMGEGRNQNFMLPVNTRINEMEFFKLEAERERAVRQELLENKRKERAEGIRHLVAEYKQSKAQRAIEKLEKA